MPHFCRNNNFLGAIQHCSDLFLFLWMYSFDLALLRESSYMLHFRKICFLWTPFAIRFFDHYYFQYNLLSSSGWKWQKLKTEKPIWSFSAFHFARIGLFPAIYKIVYFSWQRNSHHLLVHLA